MPSPYDSCRPIAVECPSEGGSQLRTTPQEMDPTQDAVAVAGVHLVGPGASSLDKTTYLDRAAGGLRLTDANTQRLLSELLTSVAGGVNAHNAIRDIQHFLGDEGPGDGFVSGAYFTRTFNGVLPLVDTWWANNSQSTKIISKSRSYPAGGVLPSSVTWSVYTAAGAVARTLTDSITYSGVLISSVTRTWS